MTWTEVFDFARSWGWAAALAANALIVWIGWSLKNYYSRFATREQIQKTATHNAEALSHHQYEEDQRLGTMDNRITAIELRLEAMPTHKDMESLRRSIDALSKIQSQQIGEFGVVRDQINTISSHLLARRRSDPQ